MTIDEIVELDITQHVYKIERQYQQIKADVASEEKENQKKIKKLTAELEQLKMDIKDEKITNMDGNEESKLEKMKQTLIAKNKLIGDLRAQVEAMNTKIQKLSAMTGYDSNGGKDYTIKPEDLSVKLHVILREVASKPDEDSQESTYAKVVSYLTHKNCVLEQRLARIREQESQKKKDGDVGEGNELNQNAKEQIEQMKKELEMAQEEALSCQMKMSQQMMMVGELNDKLVIYSNTLKKHKIPYPK